MAQEISTPVAFVNGIVEVNGLPAASEDQVFVNAEQDGMPTNYAQFAAKLATPQTPKPYSLTVRPGSVTVWAKLGQVESEKHKLTVAPGQSDEVNFSFGVDKD